MFNTIHTMRQSLSLLAPFKILLLSLKVSDLIYDINFSTSHHMCSEENIYPSTVCQMVWESLYTCIDDVFTVYVYILSLNLLSFRTSFWPHLFKEDCFFLFIFKFKKTFVGKRRRRHLMLNWPWWHVNDWTCGSRVVFSVASVHKCRKRTQVQMQAKENESVFILCVVACICICVGVVHV